MLTQLTILPAAASINESRVISDSYPDTASLPSWATFWAKLNNHAAWRLEWFDGVEWVQVNEDLKIQRNYTAPDKCKLTLVFDASHAGDYRLTFAIDKAVKQYATKLSQYRYELDYGDISIVWDWSDAVEIPGLVFTHGVKDNMFWFRMRRDNVPLGAHVEIDPYLIGSYGSGNRDDHLDVKAVHPSAGALDSAVGQSFQNRAGDTRITAAAFTMLKSGNPTGDIVAVLYAHSGTYGTDSIPTGAPLATSDVIDSSTLGGGYNLYNFTFTGDQQYTMTANTYYCIAVEGDSALLDNGNFVAVGTDSSGPTHGGNAFYYDNSAWHNVTAQDTIFYVYGGSAPTNDNLASDSTFSIGSDGTSTLTVSDYDGVADIDTIDYTVYTNASRVGLSFDGVDDYVDCGSAASLDSLLSVEVWIYITADRPDTGPNAHIIANKDNSYQSGVVINQVAGNDRFLTEFTNGTDNSQAQYIITNYGEWYHVVGQVNTTTNRTELYVNGTLVDQGNVIPNLNASAASNFLIAGGQAGRYVNDTIDEVRAYSRSLTATEVAEHYEGTYSNNNGLVLYLTFEFDVEDDSPSNNDGTINGKPQYVFDYAETFTLRWTQASESFIEITDPDNVCELSGSSARTNVDADTDSIAYVFSIGDPATEGPCAVRIVTVDDDGFNDTDYYIAFTYSFWSEVGELIDSAFEYFGIIDYMTQIIAYIGGFSGYLAESLVNTVSLVTQQIRIVIVIFTWVSRWLTRFVDMFLTMGGIITGLLNGTGAIVTQFGNWWNLIELNEWYELIVLLTIIAWFDSVAKRGRTQGEITVFFNDLQIATNIMSYFLSVFSFIIDAVINNVFRLFEAIT